MRRPIAWALVLFMLAWSAVVPVDARSDSSAAGAAHSDSVRVIELEADAALRFTQDGEQIHDIPIVPGETVLFRIENTAGFPHTFYIGTDVELQVMGGSTDVGIPEWSSGVRELTWVVPDDISGLKFGCTVPGHYFTMQGTFSEADASAGAETAAAETTAETTAASDEPATASAGEVRVIELEADAALRFLQDGEQVHDIPVVPGETVLFRVDNTAGFDHSFYIGTDEELQVMGGSTDTGIPDWGTGVREFTWVVPDDISDLRFGCTVPGHYQLMYGCFSEARVGPDGRVVRLSGVELCAPPEGPDVGWQETQEYAPEANLTLGLEDAFRGGGDWEVHGGGGSVMVEYWGLDAMQDLVDAVGKDPNDVQFAIGSTVNQPLDDMLNLNLAAVRVVGTSADMLVEPLVRIMSGMPLDEWAPEGSVGWRATEDRDVLVLLDEVQPDDWDEYGAGQRRWLFVYPVGEVLFIGYKDGVVPLTIEEVLAELP